MKTSAVMATTGFQHILYATDFSPAAAKASNYVRKIVICITTGREPIVKPRPCLELPFTTRIRRQPLRSRAASPALGWMNSIASGTTFSFLSLPAD